MKTYKKGIVIGLAAITLTACSESFLEKNPNGWVTTEQMEENATWNPNILLGQAAGIVSTTFAYGTGGISGTNHDDFGQKSIDIATDLMSGNVVSSSYSYGWFQTDAMLTNNTSDRTKRAYSFWRYYYRIIKAANTILDTVGGDGKMPDEGDSRRNFYGQAKVLRAYAYFNLVNLYARPYDVAKSEKAVPIYKTQLTAVAEPAATVDEIYTFIINDLKEAITALTNETRSDKTAPDINVAKGFLAYTYLSKGEYALAAQTAKEVIEVNAYPMLTKDELTTTGFNNIDNHSFMWAIDLTLDNSPALPTFWGMFDYFTYGYGSLGNYKEIPDNLYAEIPATDKRKDWFRGGAPYLGWWKFYDAARKPAGDALWTNDEVYMRMEEIYLIAAEASIRANDLEGAKVVLKSFLSERDEAAAEAIEEMNSDQLLELMYYNWRVEMWGEGRGLLTMKRFKKAVVRGGNDATYPGKTIDYTDSRLYFQIPTSEITNNPNL
ncbi:RagB/SusD family nutrient uptake outer membrane protein [Parabacteroides sp. 52]|uniref:RagB/SusD family nutrient uptake outer membrane protein n=1 Tax=unclassified Parabacteroides TaxID=2649774 RepID=UPI0013D551CA|nr:MULTISPECIES: RagB/SusD family nutrient uptake outer membrane protein [unclassified Parabacteroides]MDH6533911.1 hypothetical protein [Parabacteroides sp. PM5-20]NDV54656.1 RagB/SusD family nutrient uptake outer membrane protein [Parabacteroides sp. 52]